MHVLRIPTLSRRQALAAVAAAAALPIWAQPSAWAAIEARARGQKVFFNAWGGSERTNAYLQWAAAEVQARFGVQVEHVKLTDTAEAVKRVRGEKAAGRTSGGSVDVMWINGENFLTMKREGLLFGPFAESLPAFANVDVVGKPTTRMDFSEPVDGLEAPWGMAQFTLYADRRRVPSPPRSTTVACVASVCTKTGRPAACSAWCRGSASAAEVSRPPEKAMPTFWPTMPSSQPWMTPPTPA